MWTQHVRGLHIHKLLASCRSAHGAADGVLEVGGSASGRLSWQPWAMDKWFTPPPFSCLCVCVGVSCSGVPNSWPTHGLQPARLLCPWGFPGKILKWVAILFSRGSSQPKNQTRVSHITGRFFTI